MQFDLMWVITHANDIGNVIAFGTAIVTSIQAFRNGARTRALELAKDATRDLALATLSDDEKLEAATNAVYSGLAKILETDIKALKWLKLARPAILAFIPRALVVKAVKEAWHLYVKPNTPAADPALVEPAAD